MTNTTSNLYEFGPFLIDSAERLLFRDGNRIALTPKAFDTLLILIDRQGHVVEKDELMNLVWPDTAVEENNLMQNVHAIRKALGEDPQEQKYIETLPRRGYRFIAEVRKIAPQPEITQPEDSDLFVAEIKAPIVHPGNKNKFFIYLVTPLLILTTGVFYLARYLGKSVAVNQPMQITRLTNTSNVWEAAISPDGDSLAMILGDVGQQSLRLKQISTATEKDLLPSDEIRYRGVVFSPDGKSVYFAHRERNEAEYVLYQIPISGGERKRLLAGVDSAITFSPNGEQIAFVRENFPQPGQGSLMIADVNGANGRILSSHKIPDFLSVDGASWSPDGKTIALAIATTNQGLHFRIATIEVSDGKITNIGQEKWSWAGKVAWLQDGQGMIFLGRHFNSKTNNNQVWQLDYPSGQAHQLITDLNDYRALSLDQNNQSLITVQSETRANLYLTRQDENITQEITSNPISQNGNDGLDWTPDGKIVYTSLANNQKDLWLIDPSNKAPRQLTNHSNDNASHPSVSFDGQFITFNSARSGIPQIWRIGLNDSNATKLSNGSLDLNPFCSPADNTVFYSSEKDGKRVIWRTGIEGTALNQSSTLSDKVSDYPVVSPDGKFIICLYQEEPKMPRRYALISVEGGAPEKLLDIPAFPASSVRWHPDGHSLTYLSQSDGSANLYSYSLSNGTSNKLTNFNEDRIFAYAWSRRDHALAISRGTVNRDVVKITGFRK